MSNKLVGESGLIRSFSCGGGVVCFHGEASLFCFSRAARKQEIIKITEQLIEAVNNGDFEAYA